MIGILDIAAEHLKAEHQLTNWQRAQRKFRANHGTLLCLLANSPFTFTTYYLSNQSSDFSPSYKKLSGTNNAAVNCVFNSGSLAKTASSALQLAKDFRQEGWRAIAPSRTEAMTLTAVTVIDGIMSISASLPYPASTNIGNQEGQWNNGWVYFSNNCFLILNAAVYFPALFQFSKFLLDFHFRSGEEIYWRSTLVELQKKLNAALVSKNPKAIHRAYKTMRLIGLDSWEAFSQSTIAIPMEKWSCEKTFSIYLIELLAQSTALLYWFGTAALITTAVAGPELSGFWTFLPKLLGAENFWAALFFHNLSNGFFAYKNANNGGSNLGLLIMRGLFNYNDGPYLTSLIALLLTLTMLGISGGTALAQAGDGLSGVPFTIPGPVSYTVNVASGINAIMVNTGEAAFPLYAFWYLLTSAVVGAFSSCCARQAPKDYKPLYEASNTEKEAYILGQFSDLYSKAQDKASFEKALQTSPFFSQLKNANRLPDPNFDGSIAKNP
ncbi:MAG: hypothetical protein K0S29_575 [Gammaproteobacteria bacterium]|jgi:hypothetical protein|nr:hypothetical protein [Gammaproteobacteria bacterium]